MTTVAIDGSHAAGPATKIPRSVLVVIVTRDGQTLLVERADFAGFWQSVTGSQEFQESFAATAARELFEETGIVAAEHGGVIDLAFENVYCIYPRWRHRYPPHSTHNRERCFAICLNEKLSPTLAAREHVAFAWMPIARAIERVSSWSNAAALTALSTRRQLIGMV